MDFQPSAITDFLKIEMQIPNKKSIAFENMVQMGLSYGSRVYNLHNGFEPMKARYNESKGLFTLEGSIPFYWQGHNFSFSNSNLMEAIDILSENICINLYESEVKTFEFGTIVNSELPSSYILKNHLSLKDFRLNQFKTKKDALSGIEFDRAINKLKMYDVVSRFNQLKIKKIILENIEGYDPKSNFTRIENHVRKPDRYLHIRNVTLKNYCSEAMQERLKIDLMETYQAIQKKSSFILEGIQKPSVNQLLYLVLMEENSNIRKAIESKMNAFNLDPVTRKNRLRQVREDLKKFEFIPDERIDLMPLLQETFRNNSEKTVN